MYIVYVKGRGSLTRAYRKIGTARGWATQIKHHNPTIYEFHPDRFPQQIQLTSKVPEPDKYIVIDTGTYDTTIRVTSASYEKAKASLRAYPGAKIYRKV